LCLSCAPKNSKPNGGLGLIKEDLRHQADKF
jgi:hypothetical protein